MSVQSFTKQVFLLLLTTGILVTSCKKDKDKEPAKQTKQLIKVEENATNYSTFEYNPDGTLKKMTNTEDSEGVPEISTFTYSYNQQKKISETDLNGEAKLKYYYTGDNINKMEYITGNIIFMYNVFEYANNKVSRVMKYLREDEEDDDFVLYGKSEFQYFANGNLKEVKEYEALPGNIFELTYTQLYLEYDSKINPFKPFSESTFGLVYDFASANNVLKEKLVNSEGTTEMESIYTYTYDNSGYPITGVKKTTEGTEVSTENLKFIYK